MRRPRLYPPVWFVTNAALAVGLHRFVPVPIPMPPLHVAIGSAIITFGVVLSGVAIVTLARRKTPVLPYQQPATLLSRGVFRWSRNPIYLGEVFILFGIALRFGDLLAGLVIPLFIVGLNRGAITWEETALREQFGSDFDAYCRRTRRWL